MADKIPYKTLKKPMDFVFSTEVTERRGTGIKQSFKSFYISIIPSKESFWSGLQIVRFVRSAGPLNVLSGNKADLFVQDAAKIIYDLEFKIDFEGKPSGLKDEDALWKKWLALRENLAESYSGEWVDAALSKIDKRMRPSLELFPMLMKDLFFSIYFKKKGTEWPDYSLLPLMIPFKEKSVLRVNAQNYEIDYSGEWTGADPDQHILHYIRKLVDDALYEDHFTIQSFGSNSIDKETGWCNGFIHNYLLDAEDLYQKQVIIKLAAI